MEYFERVTFVAKYFDTHVDKLTTHHESTFWKIATNNLFIREFATTIENSLFNITQPMSPFCNHFCNLFTSDYKITMETITKCRELLKQHFVTYFATHTVFFVILKLLIKILQDPTITNISIDLEMIMWEHSDFVKSNFVDNHLKLTDETFLEIDNVFRKFVLNRTIITIFQKHQEVIPPCFSYVGTVPLHGLNDEIELLRKTYNFNDNFGVNYFRQMEPTKINDCFVSCCYNVPDILFFKLRDILLNHVRKLNFTIEKIRNTPLNFDKHTDVVSKSKNPSPTKISFNQPQIIEIDSDDDYPLKKKRKITIPKPLKTQIWNTYVGKTFEAKCRCCNYYNITAFDFECGHIVAEACGGKTILKNLLPICKDCNRSMGKKNLFIFMEDCGFADVHKVKQMISSLK